MHGTCLPQLSIAAQTSFVQHPSPPPPKSTLSSPLIASELQRAEPDGQVCMLHHRHAIFLESNFLVV